MAWGHRPRTDSPSALRGTVTDARGLLWEVWQKPPADSGWAGVKLVAVTPSGRTAKRKPRANYSISYHVLGARWAHSDRWGELVAVAPELLDAAEELIS